ncbi:MAG: hypothetical protein ACLFTR_00300 [Candidatus Woesearchaeota archaeon]
MRKIYLIFILSLLMFSVPMSAQERGRQSLQIQTLDDYMVDLKLAHDGTADVSQSFNIINRYSEPVIPGRAKFVLFGALEPEDVMISIGGSQRAVPEEDVVVEDGNNVVYYEIWRPISPSEELSVEINFKTDIEPQGVLFKQLDLSFGEPEIPIERMGLSLTFPTGNSLTYANLPVTEKDANTAFISIPREVTSSSDDENILVEYSTLPLPVLPFHGYWLWLLLIVMSAAILTLKLIMRKNDQEL